MKLTQRQKDILALIRTEIEACPEFRKYVRKASNRPANRPPKDDEFALAQMGWLLARGTAKSIFRAARFCTSASRIHDSWPATSDNSTSRRLERKFKAQEEHWRRVGQERFKREKALDRGRLHLEDSWALLQRAQKELERLKENPDRLDWQTTTRHIRDLIGAAVPKRWAEAIADRKRFLDCLGRWLETAPPGSLPILGKSIPGWGVYLEGLPLSNPEAK